MGVNIEDEETPGPDEVYRVGTLASIHRLFRAPDGTIRLLVQGIDRIRITEFTSEKPYLKASILPEPEELIVEDEDAEIVSEAIKKAAYSGKIGDGKIFIYNIDQVIRIRTGEKDSDAV